MNASQSQQASRRTSQRTSQQAEAWRRALAAKRGFHGEPGAGDANASVSKGGVGRAGMPRRVRNDGRGGGRGFMPFKATGHKGGISRQG